jgi:hypothetical protein
MAIGTPQIYDIALDGILKGTIDWDADTFYVMLMSSYTPADTHADWTAVDGAGNECTDADYPAGGVVVANEAVNGTGTKYLDSDAFDFGTNKTISATHLIVFKKASGAMQSDDIPIFYVVLDGGSAVSSTSGIFKITPLTNGWLSFNQA